MFVKAAVIQNATKGVVEIKTRGFEFTETANEHCKLPIRSTQGSAGYDFFNPDDDFLLLPGESKIIWTGIKAYMQPDDVLLIDIRSSLGRQGIILANTIGIVDSDYYNNTSNEGEIGICLRNVNPNNTGVLICRGDKIAQGIFIKYLKADEDAATSERAGGFGSTGK